MVSAPYWHHCSQVLDSVCDELADSLTVIRAGWLSPQSRCWFVGKEGGAIIQFIQGTTNNITDSSVSIVESIAIGNSAGESHTV